jgi:hypothetical protein
MTEATGSMRSSTQVAGAAPLACAGMHPTPGGCSPSDRGGRDNSSFVPGSSRFGSGCGMWLAATARADLAGIFLVTRN